MMNNNITVIMRSQINYKIELSRNESGREITIILHIRKVIAAKG